MTRQSTEAKDTSPNPKIGDKIPDRTIKLKDYLGSGLVGTGPAVGTASLVAAVSRPNRHNVFVESNQE